MRIPSCSTVGHLGTLLYLSSGNIVLHSATVKPSFHLRHPEEDQDQSEPGFLRDEGCDLLKVTCFARIANREKDSNDPQIHDI